MSAEDAALLQIVGMILTAIGWLGIIHTIADIEPPEEK